MKPKKNPKFDLNRNIGLYFVIGLSMVLTLSWVAIEWKTYEDTKDFKYTMKVDEDLDEEVPVTELNTPPPPPPPPPPPAPEIIQVVEDEADIEEEVIESTETSKEEVIDYSDLDVAEEEVDVEVPFAIIEEVPAFPGCERFKKKKAKLRKCFQDKMNAHIRKNFNYPEIAQEMGIQGRVNVIFTIDVDGSITNIRTRGPDKSLEKEAERIIKKLPKMTPGKQRGKPVKVPFAIPIVFRLQ